MARSDFPGSGLNEEQWQHLKALATSLTPEQYGWVGGYFTGYADAARGSSPFAAAAMPAPEPVVATAAPVRTLTVLYGSETGTGIDIAEDIARRGLEKGLKAVAIDMADYKPAALKQEQDLLVVCSTHGEGEPPQPALGFFEFLDSRKVPRLEGVRFAVLALGDSTYEFYCEAGKRLDRRLEELGAERLAERIDCDVDQIRQGREWAMLALDGLAQASAAPAVAATAAALVAGSGGHDEANPFMAEVLENIVITGRGSSKETRHLELGLAGSGLSYEPGDALGIAAVNDRRVVDELLDSLGLDGAASLTIDGKQRSLAQALESEYEIAATTPRFLQHWAELSGAAELKEIAEGGSAERIAWLEAHHVIDIVRRHPVGGVSAEGLTGGLRRLQPRLYSIASSPEAAEGDVHLTVSTVRYELNGSERRGVVSGALGRLADEARLPVYVKPNPHFRLPSDDLPIIMIGAGTGVAPYRAFVQHRALRGAKGRSWLFFGERNFRSDFLYQTEWQGHLANGSLTLIDLAFSRDGAEKVYVQHRIRERALELYAWLEEGAHLYVCGDAKGMAPDVHQALLDGIAEASGRPAETAAEYLSALQRGGRYQRDVY